MMTEEMKETEEVIQMESIISARNDTVLFLVFTNRARSDDLYSFYCIQ